MERRTYYAGLAVLLLLFATPSSGQNSTIVNNGSAAQAAYPDSVEGLQSQMDELIHLIKSADEKPFLVALDLLAIPQTHEWFTTHFPAYAADQLQKDYEQTFAGYRSHLWWVMGNFAKEPGFAVRVETSQLPEPLDDNGFEALLPRPDNGVKIENFRVTPMSSKPPSWVSSFVYIDGRFRFVGGTYPFWNEKLTPLRGPMAIPAQLLGDVTVQGVPIDVDPKTPGIIAIVVLDVKIGNDGRAQGFTTKSGDSRYVKQAEEYVRDWKFHPMATTLHLNIVFFNTTH